VTAKKARPTPKQKPQAIPAGAVQVDFQEIINSYQRQIAEQAGKIAVLEARLAVVNHSHTPQPPPTPDA
jgi:hypothetical protein